MGDEGSQAKPCWGCWGQEDLRVWAAVEGAPPHPAADPSPFSPLGGYPGRTCGCDTLISTPNSQPSTAMV